MKTVTRFEDFVPGTRLRVRTKQGIKTVDYDHWKAVEALNEERRWNVTKSLRKKLREAPLPA